MMWTILVLSLLLNIFCVWYIRNILRDYFYVLENMEDLFDVVENFSRHLETIHSLETFYGEPTLQSLIKHSKAVVEEIGVYKNVLSVGEEDEVEEDGEEETGENS